jgi:hypothetical protein
MGKWQMTIFYEDAILEHSKLEQENIKKINDKKVEEIKSAF